MLALVLIVAAAGCGGGGSSVPDSAIAVVADETVPVAAFDAQMAQTRRAYRAQGRPFPAQGSASYERLKAGAVRLLVERTQLELVARKHGIEIQPAQVERRLRSFKQTTFAGSEARYRARLRLVGMTGAEVRRALRVELLVAALKRADPAALKTRLPVVYAKEFAPANAR